MDLKYLQKIIKMLDQSNIAEIEIEEEGTKLKLSKPKSKILTSNSQLVQHTQNISEQPLQNIQSTLEKPKSEEKLKDELGENVYEVRSPMVGTFYKSPSPDAEAYVKPGDNVKAGTVICIIEAMKLMNEIECEVSGKVIKLLVDDGQAVEYDQPLMLIEKD